MTHTEQSFANEFGRLLKKARRQADVSQTGLATAIEVHRNTIEHWERGQAQVTIFDALRIVGVLRIDLNLLLPSTSFTWGRELPQRPPQRYATLRQLVAERDPPLTAKERSL
jgi:DNA-binding XRE family transcriptional regulator